MGRTRGISAAFLDRGLLRAVLLAFALFLAYRFLAKAATTAMIACAAAGIPAKLLQRLRSVVSKRASFPLSPTWQRML